MASKRSHPTYPNPTVVEAMCHIDFTPSAQSRWHITRPTEFLQSVSADYPDVELNPAPAFSLRVGPAGVGPQIIRGPQQLRVMNDSRNRYLAAGDRHLTFGRPRPYPGWEKFREYVLLGWQRLLDLAKPQIVVRTTLRYVNVIPRTAAHPQLSDWINPTETIPETLVRSKGEPFLLRLESWTEEKSLIVVTIGLAQTPGPPSPISAPIPSPILFDIDRTSHVSTLPDSEKLGAHIDRLHDQIWQEFASAHTPQLVAPLQGTPT